MSSGPTYGKSHKAIVKNIIKDLSKKSETRMNSIRALFCLGVLEFLRVGARQFLEGFSFFLGGKKKYGPIFSPPKISLASIRREAAFLGPPKPMIEGRKDSTHPFRENFSDFFFLTQGLSSSKLY